VCGLAKVRSGWRAKYISIELFIQIRKKISSKITGSDKLPYVTGTIRSRNPYLSNSLEMSNMCFIVLIMDLEHIRCLTAGVK
jgi:hypothetical protein